MNWLAIAQECFRDEHGSLGRGLLTSVFALVVGIQRMFHLDQMEDMGFALLTGGRSCPSRHLVGGWRRHLCWHEVDRFYRSIFDVVRDFLHEEALSDDKVMNKYLKPDLLIVDDMGMKQLPKRSGEYLFEIIMRRYETRSTMMTSNRPLEDWGKLVGDVPSATAILDCFLHHAEIVSITGKSYRLRNQASNGSDGDGSPEPGSESKPAIPPAGSNPPSTPAKRSKNKPTGDNGPDAEACQS